MYEGCITDVEGIIAGSAQNYEGKTGLTMIIAPKGAVAAADVRGAAPGTRELEQLRPGNAVDRIHAIMLTGGSAFGLDAAAGAMRYLEEHGIGFSTGHTVVPIIPAAVIYDLGVGDFKVRPDAAMAYAACESAGSTPLKQGLAGAGTGASISKLTGAYVPGGLGCASLHLAGGVLIAAAFAVNALGDVVGEDGAIIAGAKGPDGSFVGCEKLLLSAAVAGRAGENTTIGVIATNAKLDKGGAYRLCVAGHDGLARAVRPSHTMMDGDAVFAMSTGDKIIDPLTLAVAAAEVASRAIRNAVTAGALG